MTTISAAEVGALAGLTRDDILKLRLMGGIKATADRRPDLPPTVRSSSPDDPRWDRDIVVQWAAEWSRVEAQTQAEIDAAEKAARDAHAERNALLATLVPELVYGVPVFSAATLPRRPADRPERYLYVGQQPLRYDHGRLVGPSYAVEGVALDRPGFAEVLLLRGSNVVPERFDVERTLGKCATRLGTPAIQRFAELYTQADPALWRETASDVQALMVERMTRHLFGEVGWRSTSAHLGLDRKAKDAGQNNVFKKISRADEVNETEDLDRLARARLMASMLGIDLDVDLRA